MTDREKYLSEARKFIGKNGDYVCNKQLGLGAIYDWCAYVATLIFRICGWLGKYVREIEGGAGDIPRYSEGKYGTWFKKGTRAPQPADLFFLRYGGKVYSDKYHADHVGIVEKVDGDTITTLEGNVDGRSGNWAATSTFKRKTRRLSDGIVYAFYRPDWVEPKKTKSVDELAKEVITGKWGSGNERRQKLTAAGYDYNAVQKRVNELMSGRTQKKSVENLAREVIQGKWGSGDERKRRLTDAGYDYGKVQAKVNEIMR